MSLPCGSFSSFRYFPFFGHPPFFGTPTFCFFAFFTQAHFLCIASIWVQWTCRDVVRTMLKTPAAFTITIVFLVICCETWVPLGPYRPGSQSSPTKSVRPTRRPTDQLVGPTDLVGSPHDLLKTFQKIPQTILIKTTSRLIVQDKTSVDSD
jgi:hypothetical protein